MEMTLPEGSLGRWGLYKAELSRRAFVQRFPHPFLLLGEDAQQAEVEFFTQHISHDDGPDEVFTEEEEVVPLVKGPANPYSDRIIVGRARNCDIVFRTPGISKVHADIRFTELERGELVDRGSTNGTFVCGERVVPGKVVPLESGDVIRFALLHCLFLGPGQLYDRL